MERDQALEALYDLSVPFGSPDGWCNPRNSPHIWPQIQHRYFAGRGVALSARCTETSPRLPYIFHKDDVTSVVHWGQRKLLIAEIEFLTRFGHLSDTVVYAGAAPGTHTAVLMTLFPTHKFYLYDPAPFSLDPHENLVLRQQMFTDDVAREWACTDEPAGAGELASTGSSAPVLFICDIRSADFELMGTEESDRRIRADMEDQKRWTQLMRPAMASLKFRLPWERGQTTYLAGDVYFQIWAPPKSTETRLFTDGRSEMLYDNERYEQQCFYHNTVVRLAMHRHEVLDVQGVDFCGDCAGEIMVLQRYLDAHGGGSVGELMERITVEMRGSRTLADVVDPVELKKRITQQQWIDGKPAYLAD